MANVATKAYRTLQIQIKYCIGKKKTVSGGYAVSATLSPLFSLLPYQPTISVVFTKPTTTRKEKNEGHFHALDPSMSLRVDGKMLWRKLFAFDHQSDEDVRTSTQDITDHVCSIIQTAIAHGRHEPLRQMLLQRLGYWLRSDVVPLFWRFFDTLATEMDHYGSSRRGRRHVTLLCAQQLTLALQFAEDAFAHCVQLASFFDDCVPLQQHTRNHESTMLHELSTSFQCLVFEDSQAVEKFDEVLFLFFSMSFQKFRGKEKSHVFDARPIRQTLLQLKWLCVVELALLRVVHAQVKKVVRSMCGEVYDELLLAQVEQWACSELLPWLEEMTLTNDAASLRKWRQMLSRHVLQEFGSRRITQLFEIIKEYPDRWSCQSVSFC